jgi:Transposase domain (DUF772)
MGAADPRRVSSTTSRWRRSSRTSIRCAVFARLSTRAPSGGPSRDLYAPIGRPSIPSEQLFLVLVGGYLRGVTSERKLVMELQRNMAPRWFVGLNLDEQQWDASTFSQNRRRRLDESRVLERHCE